MATTTHADPAVGNPDGGLILDDVPWIDYESMLKIVGERRVRVTYDAGTMEVAMPSQRHEQASQLFGLFVPRLAEELGIPYEPLGMTTWKRPDIEKGLEPDQCYYIQNEAVVRDRGSIDLEIDPPPDLAIEVDITSSSLDRLSIYAALGVPEIWRYDGNRLKMLGLQADLRYIELESSLCFPGLTASDVERFLISARSTDKIRWARGLRDWVRDEFLHRRPGP